VAEDRAEVLVPEPRRGADRLGDAHGLCVLDDDVLDVHSELLERRLVVEDAADLIEGETEVPQRQQPMQAGELTKRRLVLVLRGPSPKATFQPRLVAMKDCVHLCP
jgi:hypothetical protein